ncbi:MAG: sigma-70 family RNA polymerase sigma factor, partial [Desulfocapsa sp.]|nr:sigma-70 family RNA polymerase sigma factor [Desulfocapsa sp.]
KSFKPKQQILNEIRQDVANISKTLSAGGEYKNLQSKIEVQYQRIDTARNIMIRANLPLVIATAKQYKHTRSPLNDLVQEGNLGLMRAVLRFDYTKGFRFSTYAVWWIKQSISKAIVDKGKEIRLPCHFNELSKKYFRVYHTQKEDLGRAPTLHEMSKATKIPMNNILLIIESASDPLSLETPVGDDNGTLFQFLENEKAESPYHQTFLKERIHKVNNYLSVLTERQRDVVCLRFGLEGQGECTLQEIGDKFQVTRECIRQTELKALRNLRRSIQAHGIKEYCTV